MFPDNRVRTGFSLVWLRLVLFLVLLGILAGLGLWWKSARAAPDEFVYLHGPLTSPDFSSAQIVFRLSSPHGQRAFSLAKLEALPAVQYKATQPQLKRSFVYTGVPLRDLARLAGLSGQNLRVMADDEFGATIRASDYGPFPVMLAYLADGHLITSAQKGPLEVVFPNAQYPARFQTYGSQWVWFATSLGAAP